MTNVRGTLNIQRFQKTADAGYNTVSSQQLIDYVYHGKELPDKPVWVTYSREYSVETGRLIDSLAYPGGQYSELSEIAVHENGIKISVTNTTECRNTIVKGLPQTLYAMCRYNVTDETTDSELLKYLRKG